MNSRKLLAAAAVGLVSLGAAQQASAGFVYHVSQTAFGRVNFDATFQLDALITADTVLPLSSATAVAVNSFDTFVGVAFDLASDDALLCNRQTGAAACDIVRFQGATGNGSSFGFDPGQITSPGVYTRDAGGFVGTLEITQTNDVPEPGIWLLTAAALAGLGLSRRRPAASAPA